MFVLALIAVAVAGFISLSMEIVCFRVFAYITGGTASSFGVVLSVFLLGIALGALAARRWCDPDATMQRERLRLPAILMIIASIGGYLLVPIVAWTVQFMPYALSLIAVLLVAAAFGAVLPLIAHFGIPADDLAGERLSFLYLANIVGSAAGSLITGFVLLDVMSLQQVNVLLVLMGLLLALVLFIATGLPSRRVAASVLLCTVLGSCAVLDADARYDGVYEKLLFKEDYTDDTRFAHTIETRSGVINVTQDGEIYGGGVYDGVFSTSLFPDRNLVIRPYALSAVHPDPKHVLMVGLSSGSWAQVLAHAPGVEKLTIIEINPGYLDLIPQYPPVASLVDNPRVEILIDDGRRWLVANPDRKFDAIIQNTTWHWRGHITNLLSTEYHELVKAHLNEGGVFGYNCTGSEAAQKTGCHNFKYGLRILSFVYVSMSPVVIDRERWRQALTEYRIDGQPVFDLSDAAQRERLEEVLSVRDKTRDTPEDGWTGTCETMRKRFAHQPLITDDNMATEWYRPWYASN